MLHSIADLIAASGGHDNKPSIAEKGPEFPFKHQNDVAALAPVISGVLRRVLHHPHSYVSSLQRTPTRHARRAGVLGRRYLRPINGGEWNIFDPHGAWVYQRPWCRASRRRNGLKNVSTAEPTTLGSPVCCPTRVCSGRSPRRSTRKLYGSRGPELPGSIRLHRSRVGLIGVIAPVSDKAARKGMSLRRRAMFSVAARWPRAIQRAIERRGYVHTAKTMPRLRWRWDASLLRRFPVAPPRSWPARAISSTSTTGIRSSRPSCDRDSGIAE